MRHVAPSLPADRLAENKRWERSLANQTGGRKESGWAQISRPPGVCHSSAAKVGLLDLPTPNSEVELQAELKLTGRVCRARNRSESSVTDVYVRNTPDRRVCQVERLKPEFETLALGDWELVEE